jgi:DNA-binding response OmpR family regulator
VPDQITADGIRLLAVDDDDDVCDLIVRVALRCGYESFAISKAESVKQTVDDWRPHVLTLDLGFPGYDQLDLIRTLASTSFQGQLIVVSGASEQVCIQACELASKNGCKSPIHMGKPVQLALLRDFLLSFAHPASSEHNPSLSGTQCSRPV